jgi:hypothetical protein
LEKWRDLGPLDLKNIAYQSQSTPTLYRDNKLVRWDLYTWCNVDSEGKPDGFIRVVNEDGDIYEGMTRGEELSGKPKIVGYGRYIWNKGEYHLGVRTSI